MNAPIRRFVSAHCQLVQPVAIFAIGAAMLLTSTVTRGGSIFDDDYTPARRSEGDPKPPTLSLPATPASIPTRPAPDAPLASPKENTDAVRRAVPDQASRAKCRKAFEEVYADALKDHSLVARKKLAQTLLKEAAKSSEGSSDRFVLLGGTIQAAAECQNLRVCFAAAKRLAKEYDVDELATKTDAVTKAVKASRPAALSSVSNIESLLDLADQLVAEDAFVTAAQVESVLQRAAPGVADAELKTEVNTHIRTFSAIREAKARLAPDIENLKQAPDDPSSNFAVGSYLCFQRGQWNKGLPFIVKSNASLLKGLATAELSGPTGSDEKIKLADGWFAEASKLPPPDRVMTFQHAGDLYRSAAADLQGLQKLAVQKRLAQIPPPSRLRRVDLLDLFDPATDTVKGVWRMQNGSLVCEPGPGGRVEFAYEPPEEYDFRISFTAVQMKTAVLQMCYSAGHQFDYQLGGWENTVAGFELLNGAQANTNKTGKRKDKWLTAGQRYTSVIKVRKTGAEAYLDGQLVTSLDTDYSNMSLHGSFNLTHDNTVGIGMDMDALRFDTVEIVEITGEGKILSP